MPAQPLAPAEPSANGSLPTLTDDATLLAFKKGDLLVLTKKQGLLASENWTLGQNDRTGKTGLVPTACLYTIPTVTKPSAQLLVTGTLPCPQPGYPRAGWSGPGMPSSGPAAHLAEARRATWAASTILVARCVCSASQPSSWYLVGAQ